MLSNPASNASVSRILAIVVFTSVSMCSMGIPLAVLPTFLHDDLHYGAVVTGLVLGLHSVTMLIARPLAGRIGDRVGPKSSVTLGLWICAGSGLLTLIAILLTAQPVLALAVLTVGRLLLGAGTGFVNTGTLSWGIAAAGQARTARVISYSGVMAFSSLAFAPPLGALIAAGFGPWAVGGGVLALNMIALAWAYRLPATLPVPGQSLSFLHVFGRIAPIGTALALGAAGFAATTTFVTLYFSEQGWEHAAWAMTAFGIAYVGMRVLFTGAVERYGSTSVALVCFAVETLGLATLGLASAPIVALLGAALLGLGQALLYSSLAVEVVARVPQSNRTSALGVFSLCFDLSLILSGPIFGVVASATSFRWVFLSAALMSLAGLGCAWRLHRDKLAGGIQSEDTADAGRA